MSVMWLQQNLSSVFLTKRQKYEVPPASLSYGIVWAFCSPSNLPLIHLILIDRKSQQAQLENDQQPRGCILVCHAIVRSLSFSFNEITQESAPAACCIIAMPNRNRPLFLYSNRGLDSRKISLSRNVQRLWGQNATLGPLNQRTTFGSNIVGKRTAGGHFWSWGFCWCLAPATHCSFSSVKKERKRAREKVRVWIL